jgi:hypothetical protein
MKKLVITFTIIILLKTYEIINKTLIPKTLPFS